MQLDKTALLCIRGPAPMIYALSKTALWFGLLVSALGTCEWLIKAWMRHK